MPAVTTAGRASILTPGVRRFVYPVSAFAALAAVYIASQHSIRTQLPLSAPVSTPLLAPFAITRRLFGSQSSVRTTTMSSNHSAPGWSSEERPKYPSARRSAEDKTTYKSAAKGEVAVPEPYLWLETPPSQSEETAAFVKAQAELTSSYLEGCKDRSEFQKRLTDNFSYPRFTAPSRKGNDKKTGSYYYMHNSGLDAQYTMYKASRAQLEEAEKTKVKSPFGEKWFDQNLLSKDGTVALNSMAFSKSGNFLAYAISKSGSDWVTIYFRSTEKAYVEAPSDPDEAAAAGPDRLDDELSNVKFSSITWTHDDKGVFYQRYPDPKKDEEGKTKRGQETDAARDARLYYHRLGTKQSEDVLIIDVVPDIPSALWGASVSEDGKWLIVEMSKDTDPKQRTFVASLDQPLGEKMKWIVLADDFKYSLEYITNVGLDFYFRTNRDAQNYRIVKTTLDPSSAKEVSHVTQLKGEVDVIDVIPEDKEAPLNSVNVVNKDKLLVIYAKDVKDELWQFELKTGERVGRLLPDLVGTITQLTGREEDDESFVSTMSFINPGMQTRLTWKEDSGPRDLPTSTLFQSTVVKGIDPDAFISKEVFFKSKDGTKIPMFLTYRKDTKLDGTAPSWLYFYGGFGISMKPQFSPTLMTWIASYGGSLAWVNARGGGEYGDSWHEEGRLLKKRNTFDDAISAAQYLVDEKIAAEGKIIVNGGSNGGLGAMAVGNRAPQGLLGAVVAEVGVHDMLRFWMFTAGKFWTADYGHPGEDPEIFDYNYGYSPLHNVDAKRVYPTVLLLSADHDDRVSPLHTFKMTAELQHHLPNNPNPILARIELNAGHGAGKSTQKRIEEATDKISIVARALDLKMLDVPK